MASTVVACPLCAAPLAVPPELAGQAIVCPVCRGQIQLPGAAPASAAAEPATPAEMPPVVTTAAAHRPRTPVRRTGLPLGIVVAWVATLGLVVLAGVMIWRERSARLARADAAAARPVPPAVIEPQPAPQ